MFDNKLKCCPRTTVIVLDRSSRFLSLSKQHIDLDGSSKAKASSKSKGNAFGPVYKNAWTCSIEATVEYCRIVYDLFPNEYIVQMIVSDEKAQKINTKTPDQQNLPHLLRTYANLGPPKPDNEDDCSVSHGLSMAVQCIGEAPPSTLRQKSERTGDEDNKARIICLTTLKNEAHLNALVTCVNDAFQHQTGSCHIQNLDLTIIHVIHASDSSKFTEKIPKVSSSLCVSIHSIKSSQLVYKLSLMVRKHFTLKSTTVTGIPMKEEQHSGSSANYDVEILHAAEVHHDLSVFVQVCGNNGSKSAVVATNPPVASTSGKKDASTPKDTVFLKWCTPKNSSANELYSCLGAYRITPVEVNSRPTSCLISFLLQGRNVMLEQPRKSGSKVISHILMSHGGDIYIHAISTSRTPNEDPPSISEGVGGRVTDYRINDFGEFMKSNRLAPWPKKKAQAKVNILEKSHNRLERCTRHWPMVISDTLIGNMMPHLEPLATLVMKEVLTDQEVLDCKAVIYRLQSMESRNDVLPITLTGVRGKGPKRDEQYRQLWAELEIFLETASKTSFMHEKIYDCVKISQSPGHSNNSSPMRNTPTEELERMNVGCGFTSNDMAWKDIDKYHSMSERERTDFDRSDTNNDHFFKRGRNTPDPEIRSVKKLKTDSKLDQIPQRTGQISYGPSLLSIWTNKLNSIAAKRHEEFAGRLESDGCKAELYRTPSHDCINESGRGTPVKEWSIT